MYLDEGYVKYSCTWEEAQPLPQSELSELNHWRSRMYDLGMIGYYPDLGVGYGNISQRYPGEGARFIISGTQTGHLKTLHPAHYTRVVAYSISENRLQCRGPIRASSESLTHAAVYELSDAYQGVIHAHDAKAWKRLCGNIPTTRAEVPYGSPEMAEEVHRLYKEEDLAKWRIFAMAGHEEGLVAFGNTLQEAAEVLIEHV